MGEVCAHVYRYSLDKGKPKAPVKLIVSVEGKEVYKRNHNAIVSFRQKMESENLTSIKSKSLGMLLILPGAINRLREGEKKSKKHNVRVREHHYRTRYVDGRRNSENYHFVNHLCAYLRYNNIPELFTFLS